MPPDLLRPHPGLHVLGATDDLPALLASVRMTAAPLRFGAGIKGKVLDSLAAGVPCICIPTAAEGIPLGPALASLVAPDAPGLAASILRLHRNPRLHAACRREGLALITAHWTEATTDIALNQAALPSTCDHDILKPIAYDLNLARQFTEKAGCKYQDGDPS